MGCTPSTHKEDSHLNNKMPTHLRLNPKEVSDQATSTYTLLDYFTVRHMFKFLKVLGHGKFGVVLKARSLKKPEMKVAIKIVKINSVYERNAIAEEKKILKELDHPNIVKYLQDYQDEPYLYIVTEFCSGGSLFHRLAEKEVLTEGEASKIIEKLLLTMQYFHSKNIAHRDIKPEHILFSSTEENAEIKLIDFGLAKHGDGSCPAYQTVVGTPYYVAPEVIDGDYSYSCDIWSIGVIMHYMLSGEMPFSGATVEELFLNIKESTLNFDKAPWKKVSDLGKDLLGKVLEQDPSKRLDASQALGHRWFSHCKNEGTNELDREILKKWRLEQGLSKFKNSFLNISVSSLREEDVNELLYLYNVQDTSRDGYITIGEIIDVFHKRFPHVLCVDTCLLYTSPSPRDLSTSRMPSSA
eukprot:TRINITY_DN58894_c0_g1_i2.p1 TRINITY_DN58894_c0_g1~~TRINITY_DN58894_c0_g1_i2.p1  ORF type:complete len:411 (+),score=56.89 TRINITY_DN58894_c0_g1_i2:179-1411(+)